MNVNFKSREWFEVIEYTLPWSSFVNRVYGLISSASITEAKDCMTFQAKYVCNTSLDVLVKMVVKFFI
jgi:hypothetical protein